MTEASLFETTATGCVLRVHVQPGAGRDAIAGRHGDSLKVRIRAAAHEGAANSGLVAYLAARLDLSRAEVEIVGGHRSRSKRVRVPLTPEDLTSRLDALLDESPQTRHASPKRR